MQKAPAERDTIQARSALELECFQKESDARVAATTTAATAQVPKPRIALAREENNIQGEIPPEVPELSLQFVGFPQEEIVKIFHNKFKPINLYWLCHMRGLSFEAYQNEERIGIKDGMLKLRKSSGLYKDYHNSFYEV